MPITDIYNHKFELRIGPIMEKLKEFEIVIGGSIVLSVINDEEYPNSDIDIYVGYDIVRREDRSIVHPFNDFIVNEIGGVLTDNISYQNKSYKYICPNITLNIIHTGCKTKEAIIEYIKNTSDLDICTSTFDGYRTIFTISVLTKNASIINKHLLESTFECKDENNRNFEFERFKKVFDLKRKTRQIKYINRGFTINGACLDELDYHNANTFITNQIYNEKIVYQTLKFIVDEIKKNVDNKCLNDFFKGREIFHFRNDSPILPINCILNYEFFPWAKKW